MAEHRRGACERKRCDEEKSDERHRRSEGGGGGIEDREPNETLSLVRQAGSLSYPAGRDAPTNCSLERRTAGDRTRTLDYG